MFYLIFAIFISFSFVIAAENNCLKCHNGIENIRDPNSEMMKEIFHVAKEAGYPGNDCIVCHGGNPSATTKEEAHKGTIRAFVDGIKTEHGVIKGPQNFYPDPGSPWINKYTCGMCHKTQVMTQYTSLMFTEAGKIQGSLWGFGGLEGYQHKIGNYNVHTLDIHKVLGTETYKKYMQEIKKAEPQVYPISMKALPPAPTAEEVEKNPQLAVYTYLRQECLRCHTGVRGRQKRGDYRGMGCSACHIPYSNEGFYEGNDPTIPKNERGHLLVHEIQGTREAKVKVHGITYSGIPVETCTTCHDRGKRIGVSYQGLMETAYKSPFLEDGSDQPKLHTKHYLHLHADIHMRKGMLCQDCHTSIDVHSDGILAGTTLAPVEVECQDCHGTPDKYPWELPLGYGDEVKGEVPAEGKPRGVADTLLDYMKQGTEYPKEDGYILTARGNPFGNVVRKGNDVIVHTAGGKDLKLEPLKKLKEEGKLNDEAMVAMVHVKAHIDKMECYACHATWAPQCYGCHIKIDYSKGIKHPDWIAMGNDRTPDGLTADARGEYKKHLIDGNIVETRSYLRWENPPLAVNGEHRISPAIPGCQTTVTVIGKDGKPLLLNHIFKIPNVEGAGKDGQLAIDISPVQPHTIQKEARKCESCHTNPVAMGYGIEEGKLYADPSKPYIVDLMTADGKVIPKIYKTQINSIPNLKYDWSRFVSEKGQQLQTVGHHFSGSRPLNNEERAKLDRRGVCLSCHQTMPNKDLAVSLMVHVKEYAGIKIDREKHNSILHKLVLLGAWVQVLGVAGGVSLLIGGIFWYKRRKNKR
ncbi:multiheme c-type cytochrome [Persephonella sp.]|uniref:multiheme c-type cytochrome n=1 Tax=Persephonella sp. TaxID=2060922 RepID=UPI00260F5BAB|nr:multiheme c-type cytochrome [Persephonella sp.]